MMKRLFISSTLALTLAATTAFCQQPSPQSPNGSAATQQQPADQQGRHHSFDPHKAAQRIGKRLNLTEDQTAKLEPILATQQQKMAALRSDTSLTRDQRLEQFKTIHQDTKSQLATILTPDQLEQLQSMHRHGRRGHRQPQADTANPPSAS